MGVIFSVFVAAFVVFQAVTVPGSRIPELVRGGCRLALLTAFALLVAAQAIFALRETQIEGVAGAQRDSSTTLQRWNWATQWSLPKREALGLIVPGLFGFRMDSPDGGRYWGDLGREASWDAYFAGNSQQPKPERFLRYSGGGNYAGVMVVAVALWAAAQSLRRHNSVFSRDQRRWLWFWLGTAVISLVLGFGRYAPFYTLVYHLPYGSTIRNPVKFLDLVSLALVVLFAHGVDGLWRTRLQAALPAQGRKPVRSPSWWQRLDAFDRWWMVGLFAALGISGVACFVYAQSQAALVNHLVTVLFSANVAREIAAFSVTQTVWFVVLLALAAVVFALILGGSFHGAKAGPGCWILGGLVVLDLLAANLPWPVFWNYADKYASNGVIDYLRRSPEEHRVAILTAKNPQSDFILNAGYTDEWLPHEFPYSTHPVFGHGPVAPRT